MKTGHGVAVARKQNSQNEYGTLGGTVPTVLHGGVGAVHTPNWGGPGFSVPTLLLRGEIPDLPSPPDIG